MLPLSKPCIFRIELKIWGGSISDFRAPLLDVFCDEKDSSFALVFLSFVVTQDYDDGRDITEVLKYACFA